MRAGWAIAALALTGCGPDVIVGENEDASLPVDRQGDSGLLAARYDPASGLVIAAGHHGCAEPSNISCDAWLAQIDELEMVTSIDLYGSDTYLQDTANALWLLGPRDRVLAGVGSSSGEPRALALRHQDYSVSWTTEELSLASQSSARAIEGASDGSLVVAGNELADDGELDGFVARIDSDGNVLSRRSLFATSAADSELSSAASTADGRVLVAGVRRSAGARLPVVVELSSELEIARENAALDLAQSDGHVTGLIWVSDMELLLCGSADGQAFVGRVDGQLELVESVLIGDDAGAVEVRGCAPTDDAGIVLVGAAGSVPWLAKIDRTTLDVAFRLTPGPESASLWAVTGTALGRALAVGRNEPTGRPFALYVDP